MLLQLPLLLLLLLQLLLLALLLRLLLLANLWRPKPWALDLDPAEVAMFRNLTPETIEHPHKPTKTLKNTEQQLQPITLALSA